MTPKIYSLIFCSIVTLNISAHNLCKDESAFSKLNFTIGLSRSAQNWDPHINIGNYRNQGNSLYSIYFGLERNVQISSNKYLSIGIQHIEKGFKTHYITNAPTSTVDTKYSYSLNYIELPFYLRHSTTFFKINWKVGVYFAYLYQANYMFEETELIHPIGTSVVKSNFVSYAKEEKTGFNKYDFGFNLGLSKSINDYFECSFIITKGYISPNQMYYEDIKYNQTFMLGIEYKLK
jgi:hypothetical protein